MTKRTRLAAWVGYLLLLGAVGAIVLVVDHRYTGESAESICARIQEGMSAEEVEPILKDCTFEGAYGGEGEHCYYRCPNGTLLEVMFDLCSEGNTAWPCKVISRRVADISEVRCFSEH